MKITIITIPSVYLSLLNRFNSANYIEYWESRIKTPRSIENALKKCFTPHTEQVSSLNRYCAMIILSTKDCLRGVIFHIFSRLRLKTVTLTAAYIWF